MRTTILATIFVFSSTLVWAQDFPRESIEGIPLGTAEPFVGAWSVAHPDSPGTIVNEPLVTCADPVTLRSSQDGSILRYASPKGQVVDFEMMEFSGRTTWVPDVMNTSISVWVSPDQFYLYDTDMGTALWDDPLVYSRCQ